MKAIFQKSNLVKLAIILYILLSSSYIVYTQFRSFQVNTVQSGFVQGRVQTIEELIQQANNANCQPFFVYTEEQEVELINVACLRPVEEVAPESAPTPDNSE